MNETDIGAMLALGGAWFAVFLFSTTLHEAAHAWAALRLGDNTAYAGGQVSLNPVPHIRREPFGMLIVPILSFVLGGWMFGWASAPYDPNWAMRYPKRAAWMALAGPMANFAIVLAAALGIRAGLATGMFVLPEQVSFSGIVLGAGGGGAESLAAIASIAFTLNLVLGIFNLLPVPPLDGSAVIQLAMSDDLARRYRSFLWGQPMLAWVGILVAWRLFGPLFFPIFGWALSLLFTGVQV